MQSNSDILVAFYLGKVADLSGRRIDEIWSWNYDELEYIHDYIQWLFPLRQQSRYNPDAPLLDDEVIKTFRANEQLRQRLLVSFRVMLKFYGLQYSEQPTGNIETVKSAEYPERKQNWLRIGNHNYLRITRILTCMRSLGLEKYSQSLLDCLERIYSEEGKVIGETTLRFWREAVEISNNW